MNFVTKDQAAPATTAVALDLMSSSYKRAFSPPRLRGAMQILKGQAVPDQHRGALPMLPTLQTPTPSPQIGIIDRLKGAANYAFMGDPRAFFPPGYPLGPQAPPAAAGRKWDYPFYYNVQIQPRAYESVTFDMLRSMSEAHDLLRTVLESCKNRIGYQDWSIMPADQDAKQTPAGTKDRIKWATAFFQRPDLKHPFSTWARELLEDMLTVDAMCIYNRPTLSGSPHSFVPIDGATINVKIDYGGEEPEAPEPAYQQILKGLPAIDYTNNDLIYLPFNRRSHKAYGYSPVEQIMVTINIAIRRQWWQLEKYISGAHTPYLIKTPTDWTQEQIEAAQTWYNSVFIENQAQKWRAIMMPNGCEPLTMGVTLDEKGDMDDWLAGLICFAFNCDRSQLIKPMNRASAQHGGDQASQDFQPFSIHFETSVNELIYRCFGWEDIRFRWKAEQDFMTPDKSKAIETYANIGVLQIDDVRELLGYDPLPNGAGQQCVLGANMQLVQIDEVNKLSDQNAQAEEAQQNQHAVAMATAQNPATHVHVGTGSGADSPGANNGKGSAQADKAKQGPGAAANKRPNAGGSAVKKAFDVTPSTTSGLQGYGGDNRSRTMMHARGNLRHKGRKRKRKITRTANLTLREPSDHKVGQLKAVIGPALKRQGERVAEGMVRRLRKFEKAGKPTKIVHTAVINTILAQGWQGVPEQVAPILEGAASDTASELIGTAQVAPIEEQWDYIDEATTQLARDRSAELVGMKWIDGELVENPNAKWAITEDVRGELTDLVAKAEEEEWSNDQLRSAIVNADLFSEDRADMIARTELKRIDAMSANATATATGATSKRWLLSADHDEADDCDDNSNADWVDIDDDFPSGADLPPDHPNCQCVVTFGWEDQDEETGEE